jgi:hypothetical protein
MSANYKEPAKPAVESVAGFKSGEAPRAARFGQGARNLAEIADATQRRREHNEALSRRPTGPRGPHGARFQ